MTSNFWQALTRRKTATASEGGEKLNRVLNLFDLTALGVGSTLGLGIYVLAGSVAKTVAGPGVCLSFVIAAVASAFAGFCYAEFASRVPKAGSAYVYSYVCVGEFVAFVIGWNLILEYVIGTASVARGLSGYIDAMTNNTIQNTLTEYFPMNVPSLSPYPDFLSFGFVLLLAFLLAVGAKESSTLNNIFTVLNIVTICIVIVAGSFKADPKNWKVPIEEVPAGFGTGGFLPFGFGGVMAGAAKCFYGFVGFDCIATTGEEAKNPKKNIPFAIIMSLIIIFFAYFGVSVVLTLMVPYYNQDPNAPLQFAFKDVGMTTIMWIVTGGATFALCASLLGAMFPLPRILYAMANDGVIFRFLGYVHPRTKTPLYATIISGLLAGIMALLFDIDQLINMMSIGTLLAYTIVGICVLVLRYQYDDAEPKIEIKQPIYDTKYLVLKQLFNLNMIKEPTPLSTKIVQCGVVVFSILCFPFAGVIILGQNDITNLAYLIPLVILGFLLLLNVVIIGIQPTSSKELAFKVPLVPGLPCLSIFCNVYLMLELDVETWIRFVVWLTLGLITYFGYGIRHSTEKQYRLDNNNENIVLSSTETIVTKDAKDF